MTQRQFNSHLGSIHQRIRERALATRREMARLQAYERGEVELVRKRIEGYHVDAYDVPPHYRVIPVKRRAARRAA